MQALYITSVSGGEGGGFHISPWAVLCHPCQRMLKDGMGRSSHLVAKEEKSELASYEKIAAAHFLAAGPAFPSKAAC